MRDWKCYVMTTDRNLSWDDRDVTGLSRWAWLVSSIPGSDSDAGVLCKWYQQSSPTPAGRRLTPVCRFALGLSELEWGGMRKVLDLCCLVWGWQPGCQFWCLTGPSLNMTQSFRLWYSPSLPQPPHISRSQLSSSVDMQPQLVCRHNLTITNQMMITRDSRVWCEKKSVMCFDCSEPLWVHLKYQYHLPPPPPFSPLSPILRYRISKLMNNSIR